MSIQSVEQRATELRDVQAAAHQALRDECKAALVAGVPIAAVARAAGVTRTTIYTWTGGK